MSNTPSRPDFKDETVRSKGASKVLMVVGGAVAIVTVIVVLHLTGAVG